MGGGEEREQGPVWRGTQQQLLSLRGKWEGQASVTHGPQCSPVWHGRVQCQVRCGDGKGQLKPVDWRSGQGGAPLASEVLHLPFGGSLLPVLVQVSLSENAVRGRADAGTGLERKGGEDNWRLNLGELHTGVSSPGPRLALPGAVAFYLNRNGSQRLVSVTSLCVPSAP